MRTFDYHAEALKLLTPAIVQKINRIQYSKVMNAVIAETHGDFLEKIHTHAKHSSIRASNRLSGIRISEARIHEMAGGKPAVNSSEQEYAGYTRAFVYIKENYASMEWTPETVLFIHKTLFEKSDPENAGTLKKAMPACGPRSPEAPGFKGAAPEETPLLLDTAVRQYKSLLEEGIFDPLLPFSIFYLDFMMINPFDHGNGRVCRLLALHSLFKTGYPVGMYISFESILEKMVARQAEAVGQSAVGWDEGRNTYSPFCHFVLEVMDQANKEFREKIAHLMKPGVTKAERIRQTVQRQEAVFTKADIIEALPDISQTSIERELGKFKQEGMIEKLRSGPLSTYRYLGKTEK